MDERDLVARSRKGDLDAFNALVDAQQQFVYNVALRMLGDADGAADVAQETFLSAYRSLDGFRDGSFRAWLGRIATNLCYDRLRWQQRHPAQSLDELRADEEAPFDPPDRGETPDEHLLRGELAAAIEQGLATLAPEQRLVVLLSDLHGLSYEEIAQATGANLGTVKSRLSRGRHELRAYFLERRELLPGAIRPSERGRS